MSDFLSQGLMLEGGIMKAGLAIREKSKTKFKQQCLDARLLLLSISLDELSEETQRLESIYHLKLTALEELKKSLLHDAFRGAL